MTNTHTLLAITPFGLPPYSIRGLTQTLDPIPGATQLRRTINGELRDLSYDQFKKYTSAISCADHDGPALDGIWPGQQVTVDCVAELAYKTAGGAPAKNVVAGSTRVVGDWTYYRPRIIFRVVNFTQSRDEYGNVTSWTMQLEEL